MSWFNPRIRAHRPVRPGHRVAHLLAVIAGLALTGCGFQPLYADRGTPGAVATEFSHIEVPELRGRVGLELRNNLIDRLSARGGGKPVLYQLDIGLTERKEGLAIQQDESVTRFNYELLGSFSLTRKSDNVVIFSDSARSSAAFNVVQSEFATLSAARDAEDRAARDLSSEILTRLGIFFRRTAAR